MPSLRRKRILRDMAHRPIIRTAGNLLARQSGSPTNIFDTVSQSSSLTIAQAFTNSASAMAVAVTCIPDTTTATAATITASFNINDSDFSLSTQALSAANWAKNAPGVAILGGTGIPTGAGTLNLTINVGGNNMLAHALSIISIENVSSFGNVVQSGSSSRSSVDMTATGVTARDFVMSAGSFQGGGTNWTPSTNWDAIANDGTDDASQFNDCTMLFQSFDATEDGNVAFSMGLNSAFAGSEPASGVILTAAN